MRQTGLTNQYNPLLASIFDTRNSLSVEEAGETIKESFSQVGKSMGIDRWIVTVLDEDCRKVNPLVWFDIDSVDPMIPQWFDLDPHIADRVRRWFIRSKEGEVQRWHLPTDAQDRQGEMIDVFRKAGIKSGVSVPLHSKGPFAATFSAFTTHTYRQWPDDSIPFFRFFGESFMAMLRCRHLAETLRNVPPIKKITLKQAPVPDLSIGNANTIESELPFIIGESRLFQELITKIKQVAHGQATVLILGETGVGKNILARAIHGGSQRRDFPFVQVNCAALAPNLIEGEFFGHEKGAFTGAVNRRMGRFEIADRSTLFLDEIGDLPLELQAKLLRVLDHGEFERIGSSTTIRTDVRIIAATNHDLLKDVEAGRFRRDLWYRLNVVPLFVPPLRERPDDIEPLVSHFIRRCEKKIGRVFDPLPRQVMGRLSRYSWPGNVREIENLIERAAITSVDSRLTIEIPSNAFVSSSSPHRTLEEIEQEYLRDALESTKWRIQGPGVQRNG